MKFNSFSINYGERMATSEDLLLNVALIIPYTSMAGPGVRTCVWFQGCSKHCPDCQNPAFQEHAPRFLITPEKLFEIVSSIGNVNGITISGGEPFQQAHALAQFLNLYHSLQKTILIFSGYEKIEIIKSENEEIKRILSLADCIITGKFCENLKDNKDALGSPNKEITFLTNRIKIQDFENFKWEMSALNKKSLKREDLPTYELYFDGYILAWSGLKDSNKNFTITNNLKKFGIEFSK